MMKRYLIYTLLAILLMVSCRDERVLDEYPTDAQPVRLQGIRAVIDNGNGISSRAAVTVPLLIDSIGRSEFVAHDQIFFTKIERTEHPISDFSYQNVEYGYNAAGGYWDKKNKTMDIYWTDAVSAHTFIGYCLPHPKNGARTEENFDWKDNAYTYDSDGNQQTIHTYYGSIGDPTRTSEVIDYRTMDADKNSVKLPEEDLLLTYDTELHDSEMAAEVYFHHALASMRVSVTLTGFSATENDADSKSKVSEMVVFQQPVMYKWKEDGYKVQPLVASDQTILNEKWSGTTPIPAYDQKKDMTLWQPSAIGEGTGSGTRFNFYGITVPGIRDAVVVKFKVTYPDPMRPNTQTQTKEYSATLNDQSLGGKVNFQSGYCTSITINLNHKNEKITVGAEYLPWQFEETPNEGELFKNTTFLASTDRSKVTILGDEKANEDDATWLYVDKTTNKIVDVYGNDGSASTPFRISTANQLLSFAYEVKGSDKNNRKSVSYTGHDNSTHTLDSNFDFKGYTVALDAGLTLQPTESSTKEELKLKNVSEDSDDYKNAPTAKPWIGIGDTGKPFNGTFKGGVRLISRLFGSPFFVELGPNAHIDQLILEDVIGVEGDGGFANINRGIICACKVDGDVLSKNTSEPVGSFVGTNSGLIFACYHIGDLTATGASYVGGLVGFNKTNGSIVASYNAGKITAPNTWKNGVLGKGESSSPSVFGCFYDKSKATGVLNVAKYDDEDATTTEYPSVGLTTDQLLSISFVGAKTGETNKNTLNGIINEWVTSNATELNNKETGLADHLKARYYVSQPAGYPWVY